MTLKQRIAAVKLVPSGGGVFEVSMDGRKLYSKLETGQFPEPDAVLKLIKARL